MADRHILAKVSELQVGQRKLCSVGSRRVALFRVADADWIVIDNHCTHRGGPVGAGPWSGRTLTCPWHGWHFDLITGSCATPGGAGLTRYSVARVGEDLVIDLDAPIACEKADGASCGSEGRDELHGRPHDCVLVRFGKLGKVNWFLADPSLNLERGQAVVVRTSFGSYSGRVLRCGDHASGDVNRARGVVERLWRAEDGCRIAERAEMLRNVLQFCERRIAELGLPVSILDGELLLNDDIVVVYYLGPRTGTLGPIGVEVANRFAHLVLRFEPIEESAICAVSPDSDFASGEAMGEGGSTMKEGGSTMKGPYERLKYDLRRVWECPVCQHRERTGGAATSQICRCQEKEPPSKRICMKLVEDGPRRV